MSTLTATPISESAVITAYNRDTASNADINTFTSAFKSVTDAIIIDLATLNTDKVDPDDDITFTGDNIFSGTNTFSAATTFTGNITFAGNLVSSGTSKTIDFNTNRAQNIGAATTSTDAIQYQQAVKATGSVTEDITGIKTFTTALPICSVVPSSGSDLVNKTYVDLQVFGNSGITQATSAPATTSGALWLNTTSTSNYELFRANGSAFAPVTGIFQGTSAPTAPTPATGRLWLDTTTANQTSLKYYTGSAWKQCLPATIDAATAFTASTTFNGGFSVASSQTIDFNSNVLTEVGTPSASTDAANKAYVDALTPRKWAATAAVTVNNTTPATLIGTGSGTYSKSGDAIIIPANTFSVGTTMRITAMGVYTRGTGTLDLSLGIGGQPIGTFSIGDPGTATSNASWKIESIVTNVTTGAPGTFYGQSVFSRGSTGAGTNWNVSGTGSSSTFNLATTTTQDVTFAATWSVTAGSVTCTNFIIEII